MANVNVGAVRLDQVTFGGRAVLKVKGRDGRVTREVLEGDGSLWSPEEKAEMKKWIGFTLGLRQVKGLRWDKEEPRPCRPRRVEDQRERCVVELVGMVRVAMAKANS